MGHVESGPALLGAEGARPLGVCDGWQKQREEQRRDPTHPKTGTLARASPQVLGGEVLPCAPVKPEDDPLETLLELTRTLGADRSLEEALQATSDAALEVLPATHASLRLFDDERHQLLCSARAGEGVEHAPVSFQAGEGVIGVVADTGKPALIEDTAADPHFVERPGSGFSIRSLVAVPLLAGGQVVGVLSASAGEAGAFGERDRDLAQLLANCTAPAIETARLARLAVTDDLTRAYNYRYYVSRLEEEVGRARRYHESFALLMLDLDFFKKVNDGWGHAAGDEVLRGFADRVRGEVRQTDIFIRRGGEEFVLLMPVTRMPEAHRVAERIRMRVAETPFATTRGDVPVTVSIGLAAFEGEEARELVARADAALYRAKEGGRDRVEVAA